VGEHDVIEGGVLLAEAGEADTENHGGLSECCLIVIGCDGLVAGARYFGPKVCR
jgi:hypothetical protein